MKIPKEIRKPQTCSFCKNHSLTFTKKGHKINCGYKYCNCDDCSSTRKRQLYSAIEKKHHYPETKMINKNDEQKKGRQRKEQKCRKCANHKVPNIMRDHKKHCQFKDCNCTKCSSTIDRRLCVRKEAKSKRDKQKQNIQNIDSSIKSEDIEIENITKFIENEYAISEEFYNYSSVNNNVFGMPDSPHSTNSYDSGFSCSPIPSPTYESSQSSDETSTYSLTNLSLSKSTSLSAFDLSFTESFLNDDVLEIISLETNQLPIFPDITIL